MATTNESLYYDDFPHPTPKDEIILINDHSEFDLTLFNPIPNLYIKKEPEYVPSPESDLISVAVSNYTVDDLLEELSNGKHSPVSDNNSYFSKNSYQNQIIHQDQNQMQVFELVNNINTGFIDQESLQEMHFKEQVNRHPQYNESSQLLMDSSDVKNRVSYHEMTTSNVEEEKQNYTPTTESPSSTSTDSCIQEFPNYESQIVNYHSLSDTSSSYSAQENVQEIHYQLDGNNQELKTIPEYEMISDATSNSSEEQDQKNFIFTVQASNIAEPLSNSFVSKRVFEGIPNHLTQHFPYPMPGHIDQKPILNPNYNFVKPASNVWSENQIRVQFPIPPPAAGTMVPFVPPNINEMSYEQYLNYVHSHYYIFVSGRGTGNAFNMPQNPNQPIQQRFPLQLVPKQPGPIPSTIRVPLINVQQQVVRSPFTFAPFTFNAAHKSVPQFPLIQPTPSNQYSFSNMIGSYPVHIGQNQLAPGNSENFAGKSEMRKKRIAYSTKMLQRLESVYKTKRFISVTEKASLSKELGLTPAQVKIWFQNRRMKEKRNGS